MRFSERIEDPELTLSPVIEIEETPQEPEELRIVGESHFRISRPRLRRREKIQQLANEAAEEWLHLNAPPATHALHDRGSIYRPIHRSHGLEVGEPEGTERFVLPPPPQELVHRSGVARTVARLLIWFRGALLFALGVLWDWLHRRDTNENRARRLRETFERMGTTFIKIGQQLSMRLDMLPYAYTRELAKMLDKLPPFPSDQAVRAIERATGQPLEQLFSAFDPEPIGSASVACVYQAVLRTGERVAVKVRRPGVGIRLAADMRALSWVVYLAELLFLSPGFTANFVYELRNMLTEELDFSREARFADLYRRRMRKTKQLRFVSVPKVFFNLSNEEVMVTEFVEGIWLSELLPALESRSPEALRKLQELNIDRITLARRIQLIARFNNFENIFFHADLHPANILVQAGNKILLIDFGSCGSFNRRELNSWRRWFDAQSVNDVGAMVQAALGIIEPLPPIDKDLFGQRLESMFWNDLYAIKSKHSPWFERISSRMWIGFLSLCREFQIPMRLNTLRMIRASMLTDTIAGRLDNDQDPYKEFRYYERGAGKRAKKRVMKRLHRLAGCSKFIRMEQGLESALALVYQVQRTVDSFASVRMGAIVAKIDYFFSLMLQEISWAFSSAVTFTIFLWTFRFLRLKSHPKITFFEAFFLVLNSHLWQILALAPIIMILWRISFRLREKELRRGAAALDDI